MKEGEMGSKKSYSFVSSTVSSVIKKISGKGNVCYSGFSFEGIEYVTLTTTLYHRILY